MQQDEPHEARTQFHARAPSEAPSVLRCVGVSSAQGTIGEIAQLSSRIVARPATRLLSLCLTGSGRSERQCGNSGESSQGMPTYQAEMRLDAIRPLAKIAITTCNSKTAEVLRHKSESCTVCYTFPVSFPGESSRAVRRELGSTLPERHRRVGSGEGRKLDNREKKSLLACREPYPRWIGC